MTASLSPLPGAVPVTAGAYDLATLGYVEEEFALTGTAHSYRLTGERGRDGRWAVEPADAAPFTTRVLLRRPSAAQDFSGTLVVEWLNVSGGLDAAPDWMLAHTHLMRRGHAWAGVSAQRAGIEGGGMVESFHLKVAHPDRYAALSHPGDAWSYDIFSQAGRALLEAGLLPAGGRAAAAHAGERSLPVGCVPGHVRQRRRSARGCLRRLPRARPHRCRRGARHRLLAWQRSSRR